MTNDAKFTPGPWKKVIGQRPGDVDIMALHTVTAVATVYCELNERPGEANAYLIAAAPDLYEALVRCRGQWIHSVNANVCLAAIAKAEGRTP